MAKGKMPPGLAKAQAAKKAKSAAKGQGMPKMKKGAKMPVGKPMAY